MDPKRKPLPRSASTRSLGANYFRLMSAFSTLRETLKSKKYSGRMDKPLAFWTTPGDRRLPQALLGHTLVHILDTPFPVLCETPGIGSKKMTTLMKLLQRVAKEDPEDGVAAIVGEKTNGNGAEKEKSNGAAHPLKFDPAGVSELQWARWRETVRRHGLEKHTLGQLVTTLQLLPTVVWTVGLHNFLNFTLADIRQLKTYGEKRVRVLLEVFHDLHRDFGAMEPREHLAMRLIPARVAVAEEWSLSVAGNGHVPNADEIMARFVTPLLDQVLIDLGPDVYRLLEGRLGVNGPVQQVGQQAKRLGVTRARVYQLFDDCQMALAARWPGGRVRVSALNVALDERGISGTDKRLFLAMRELLFTGVPENERT